jgi:hypothetical protein
MADAKEIQGDIVDFGQASLIYAGAYLIVSADATLPLPSLP